MRLATWNVNSLKVRLPRIEAWLAEVQPDVACLQETKVSDSAFPALAFGALGYETAHHGQGQWNGVAILSKVGLDDVVADFADGAGPDVDARIISATCAGLRLMPVYVPNGRALDQDHYQYKLAWLARLRAHLAATCTPDQDVAICGDFNIAPTDVDVYDPAKFEGATHVSPPERAAQVAASEPRGGLCGRRREAALTPPASCAGVGFVRPSAGAPSASTRARSVTGWGSRPRTGCC